jgi:predicted Zn-dependent peptidase
VHNDKKLHHADGVTCFVHGAPALVDNSFLFHFSFSRAYKNLIEKYGGKYYAFPRKDDTHRENPMVEEDGR